MEIPLETKEPLPDARLSHKRDTVQGPCGLMSKVFCVNCGASGGLITEEWAETVFYLCDKCFQTHGAIANQMTQIADAQIRGELNARDDNPEAFDRWQRILEESRKQATEKKSTGIKLFVVEDLKTLGFRVPGKNDLQGLHELPFGAVWQQEDGNIFIVIPSKRDLSAKTVFSPTLEVGNATGWKVEGEIPRITVTPSIFCNPKGNPPGWRGWVREGELIEAN